MTFLGLHLYQFIVVSLSAVMIVLGIHKYVTRQAGQTLLKLIARLTVWGGMLAVALFPRLTNQLADIVGLEGNINAVILIGFILIFLLIFKMLAIIERIEQDLSRLVRKDTLEQLKKDDKK